MQTNQYCICTDNKDLYCSTSSFFPPGEIIWLVANLARKQHTTAIYQNFDI